MNDDEKRIEAMTANLVRLAQRRYEPCWSDFLSESEQAMALRCLAAAGEEGYMLWGGFENAQRAMLCVYPEFCEPQPDDFPMTALHLKFRSSAQLDHRDFLGALMALGLKREALGDILIESGKATFFVKSELAGYVTGQLEKVGREGVAFVQSGVDLSAITQKFEERSCTVTSLRLDLIVGECAGLSRAKAQQTVKSGYVSVNALIAIETDKRVASGDKISIRGFGKYIVKYDGSMSKKGKYRIVVLKYI